MYAIVDLASYQNEWALAKVLSVLVPSWICIMPNFCFFCYRFFKFSAEFLKTVSVNLNKIYR